MFNELIEVVQYLKKHHNTDVIYVYTNSKDRDYRLDNSEFHVLSKFARVIQSRETRDKAYRAIFENRKIPLSLFVGNDESYVHINVYDSVQNFYAFITWDDYLYPIQRTIKQPTSTTFFGYALEQCNYTNIITKIYQ